VLGVPVTLLTGAAGLTGLVQCAHFWCMCGDGPPRGFALCGTGLWACRKWPPTRWAGAAAGWGSLRLQI